MATFSKIKLSGSTSGKPIKVTATATTGTTIHTAIAGSSDVDECWLYACNTGASSILLTLEWGGTTSPDDLIEVAIPGESGLTLIAPGLLLNGGLLITAFAGTADVINIIGFVNRIEA